MTNIATAVISQDANMGQISQLCGVDKFSMGIDKNGNLSVVGVEQEVLDAALVEYNSNLDKYEVSPAREAIKEGISIQSNKYIEQYYPSFRRELFIALAEEARNTGLTNRVAYINQLLTWVKTIVVEIIVAGDAIDAETNIETIRNYSVDFTQFDATNPDVTVRATLAIGD
jgi:hypothetical protein